MSRVRKWLGANVELKWRRWELLTIALIVVALSILWPSAPFWVFVPIGAVLGIGEAAARDLGHWLRRRRTA